jgi:clan AA aspartic protease (TIGR02281 family)
MLRFGPLLAVALLINLPAHGEPTLVRAPIPLRGDGTSWMVHATVNGRTQGLFLLDTGASYCVIAPAFARELGVPPTGSFATVHTANGAVRAPVVRLRVLDLAGTRAHDVQAIVHDAVGPSLDGVIGLNFLNRYRYSVDPERRLLELE